MEKVTISNDNLKKNIVYVFTTIPQSSELLKNLVCCDAEIIILPSNALVLYFHTGKLKAIYQSQYYQQCCVYLTNMGSSKILYIAITLFIWKTQPFCKLLFLSLTHSLHIFLALAWADLATCAVLVKPNVLWREKFSACFLMT